jgi:hypothetical protein
MANSLSTIAAGLALLITLSPSTLAIGNPYSAPQNSNDRANDPDTVQEEIVRLTKHIDLGLAEHKLSNRQALRFKYEEEKLITIENNLRDHKNEKFEDRKEKLREKLVQLDSEVKALRTSPGFTQ